MMIKKIDIDASRFVDKETMSAYLSEIFNFPEYFGNNLDAAFDLLMEVNEDTLLYFTRESLIEMASEDYSYKSLRMLVEACFNNPHLKFKLRKIRHEENPTENVR